jgi:hypothetical protein
MENLVRCFPKPECSWKVSLRNAALSPPKVAAETPRCASTEDGAWLHVNSTAARYTGSLDELRMNSSINVARAFSHIFVPHRCHYHLYSVAEVQKCLAGRRMGFIGDSQADQTARAFRRWAQDQIPIDVLREARFRTGMSDLLKHEHVIKEFMGKHDIIFTNHIMHDLAQWDAARWEQVGHHKRYGEFSVESVCKAGSKTHRMATIEGRVVALKYRPIFWYLEHLEQLFMIMNRHRRQEHSLFYIMEGNRVGYSPEACPPAENVKGKSSRINPGTNLPWNPSVLQYIYNRVKPLCAAYNITAVDASKHKFAADGAWFDDEIHVGIENDSGLQLFSNQVLFNVLCN